MCVCMHDTYIYTLYLQLAVPLDTKCVFAVWCWVWCRVLQCALQCVLQYMYHSTHNECRVLWSVMQRVAACCSACSSIYTTQHTISVECCWVWCSLLKRVLQYTYHSIPRVTWGTATTLNTKTLQQQCACCSVWYHYIPTSPQNTRVTKTKGQDRGWRKKYNTHLYNIHVHIHLYTYIYVYIYVMYIYIYKICIYIYISIPLEQCRYIYIDVYICTYIYYVYICTYTLIYIHENIYMSVPPG